MWIKLDAHWDGHEKTERVGFWGGVVVLALWRTCKRKRLDGILPAKYGTAEYLSKQLRAPEYTRELEFGFSNAMGEYINLLENGEIELVGWGDFQAPSHGTTPRYDRKQSQPMVRPTPTTPDMSDEPRFSNKRTQSFYDGIRKYFPEYSVQDTRESAVKLAGLFSGLDVPAVLKKAHALFPPGRNVYAGNNGLHGFLFSVCQNEQRDISKARASYGTQSNSVYQHHGPPRKKQVITPYDEKFEPEKPAAVSAMLAAQPWYNPHQGEENDGNDSN